MSGDVHKPYPEILLIEDDPDEQILFKRAASVSGIPATVTVAKDAPQAVMRLNRMGVYSQTPLPTMIVLDLGLTGLQGKTLLQVIRNAYGPRAIPVVVFTGSELASDRADCEALGISAYMIKPPTFAGLVEAISRLTRFLPDDSGLMRSIDTDGAKGGAGRDP
jgi:CheY-like chemotaxis protein